jgi:hypothetical protein
MMQWRQPQAAKQLQRTPWPRLSTCLIAITREQHQTIRIDTSRRGVVRQSMCGSEACSEQQEQRQGMTNEEEAR